MKNETQIEQEREREARNQINGTGLQIEKELNENHPTLARQLKLTNDFYQTVISLQEQHETSRMQLIEGGTNPALAWLEAKRMILDDLKDSFEDSDTKVR